MDGCEGKHSSLFPIPALVSLQITNYHVARNFYSSIILRIGDFFIFWENCFLRL